MKRWSCRARAGTGQQREAGLPYELALGTRAALIFNVSPPLESSSSGNAVAARAADMIAWNAVLHGATVRDILLHYVHGV